MHTRHTEKESKTMVIPTILQSMGVTKKAVDRLLAEIEEESVRRVANAFMGWHDESVSWQEAKELMGEEFFFGPEEWTKYFGVQFTEEQMEKIAEFPFAKFEMEYRRERGGDYARSLFAFLGMETADGIRLTTRGWQVLMEKHGFSIPLKRTFALDNTCKFQWYVCWLRPSGLPGGRNYHHLHLEEVMAMYSLHSLLNENWLEELKSDRVGKCGAFMSHGLIDSFYLSFGDDGLEYRHFHHSKEYPSHDYSHYLRKRALGGR